MGTVRRPALAKGTIWGHLHIVGMFDDRRPPITVDARWGSLSSRGSRSAPFSAVLPTSDPLAIQSVRIAYRAERDSARPPHLHYRSEESRGGKEYVSTCRCRWAT